jgi:hypothetical protein
VEDIFEELSTWTDWAIVNKQGGLLDLLGRVADEIERLREHPRAERPDVG